MDGKNEGGDLIGFPGRRPVVRALFALAGAVVVLLVAAAGVPEYSPALLAPEELASNTVALVSNVPVRHGTITRAELRHELVLSAVAEDLRPMPKPGTRAHEKLEERAVDSLLEAAWLYGEAGEMGIAVTPSEVARELALIKRQSFKSAAEYRKFLRESHYTRRDVNERVALQLLGTKLQRRIATRIERESRNPFEEQQAYKEFAVEFNAKWRGRTVCAPEQATRRCSNWEAPPAS